VIAEFANLGKELLVLAPLFSMVLIFVLLFLYIYTKINNHGNIEEREKAINEKIDFYITTLENQIIELEKNVQEYRADNVRLRTLLIEAGIITNSGDALDEKDVD
jgi:hypothetical protein